MYNILSDIRSLYSLHMVYLYYYYCIDIILQKQQIII